ncbi:RNA ligase family protein [Ammoniphilus sp. YIM 78166]|uniref:ATP-dependent DNA ligase n=1 Tax=Ammoniphilus sp. YIM 78166 TaxID=1644106 RepID=UPI00107019E1|nr:RNA ligase family protein [Ammoniphilus sp. YIM 78166]
MNLTPIIPFEPIQAEIVPQGGDWVAQIKWDGVRILTYFDGQDVKLFNRRINERTNHYPELRDIGSYCAASSVILDGEVIALGADQKPSFHEVMRRDGLRRLERVKEVQRQVPITYMIFDVIYCNGQWVHQRPLRERMDLLSDIIVPQDHAQLVPFHHDADTLFDVISKQGMEGIIVKDLNSSYGINAKDKRWQKKKNFRDIIAVVGGVTLKAGVVNALLLGAYDLEGKLWYIGHVGTGKLTKEEWRNLTQLVQPLIQAEKPFTNRPERMKEAIWLLPKLTVKVQYMEWTQGDVLRQPSIQSFVDISPEEARLTDLL